MSHKLNGTDRRVQDPATRAWNLLNALFYKAGRAPTPADLETRRMDARGRPPQERARRAPRIRDALAPPTRIAHAPPATRNGDRRAATRPAHPRP